MKTIGKPSTLRQPPFRRQSRLDDVAKEADLYGSEWGVRLRADTVADDRRCDLGLFRGYGLFWFLRKVHRIRGLQVRFWGLGPVVFHCASFVHAAALAVRGLVQVAELVSQVSLVVEKPGKEQPSTHPAELDKILERAAEIQQTSRLSDQDLEGSNWPFQELKLIRELVTRLEKWKSCEASAKQAMGAQSPKQDPSLNEVVTILEQAFTAWRELTQAAAEKTHSLNGLNGRAPSRFREMAALLPKSEFSALGTAFVETELANAKKKFDEAQTNRQLAISRVQQHEADCLAEERHWMDIQSRERRRDEAARRIQKWWVRVVMYGTKSFPLNEILEHHRLLRARQCLGENLLDLRRCVHDLHIEEADRENSCVRIQRWWRKVLAKRIMKIIAMYGKVAKMRDMVEGAAAKIQAIVRANRARREVTVLRETRRVAEEEAERRLEQIKMQAIVSIQNTYRKSVAVKQVQRLRARMFAAMMSQGGSDVDMPPHMKNKLQPLSRSSWLKGTPKATAKKKREKYSS
ncbi:unnamed protein product [Symbiodinium sp. CCMP2592]|nr:unnamed protein product [Symbiodinium sp. CCMP2592]